VTSYGKVKGDWYPGGHECAVGPEVSFTPTGVAIDGRTYRRLDSVTDVVLRPVAAKISDDVLPPDLKFSVAAFGDLTEISLVKSDAAPGTMGKGGEWAFERSFGSPRPAPKPSKAEKPAKRGFRR